MALALSLLDVIDQFIEQIADNIYDLTINRAIEADCELSSTDTCHFLV